MRKIVTLTIAAVLGSMTIFAQGDAKAKEILDALSKKTKAYTTIEAKFSYILENKVDEMHEVQEGVLITKGDKYFLSIGGQEILCNGTTIWTYLVDAGEVQITSVPSEEEKAEEDYISPTTIFTMYEKGFKHKYIKEEIVNGETWQMIDIFPVNPDEKSFHTIKLYINKNKGQLEKIKIMGKDGTAYTYEIKSFVTNKDMADSKFVFNKSAHPDVDYIDLR